MGGDRWTRLDDLVQAALARPLSEREAFVHSACGDDSAMATEVLSLLAHAESAGSFLEPPASTRARFEPGQQLGSYRIEAFISAGGMGEVYRARDSKLSREVALKTLPPDVARDPERLRRFEQEARAAAALNHPNIVTIHSVEQAGDLHFLTMELVEGTPLSERIPRHGLPLDRLLEIAVALADGIGAAHARGIVHRDLKPANVMVTRDGRVKILDFGLAKLRPLAGAAESTVAPAITSEGRLLGTVAYMSPEQAEGRDIDHRSDIFSLGVLLYELATGQRPFTGDSATSLLSAILKDTPASLTDVRPEMPRELARIVRRCLAKDPERRYQSAKDLRNELEELRQEVASGVSQQLDVDAARRVRRWRSRAWTAGGIAALATIAVVYLAWRGAADLRLHASPPAMTSFASRMEFLLPVPEAVKTIQGLAVSSDGTQIAFAGAGQLWRYDLATRGVSPVAGVIGEPLYPFWSPDGRSIAYFQFDKSGKLWKIPAAGGIPTKICDFAGGPRGGTWGAEDTIVLAQVKKGLFRVSAEGGVPEPITKLVGEEDGHLWPEFLPDGRHFTYMTWEVLKKVYVASLDPNEPRRQIAPARGALTSLNSRAFALSEFLLTAEGGALRARRLSGTGTDPAGEPELLAQDVPMSTAGGDRLFAASPAVLAYGVAKLRRSQFSLIDRRGRELLSVGPPVLLFDAMGRPMWSLSPNGLTLALTQIADDRSLRISLLNLTRSSTLDGFTFGPNDASLPVWSPLSDRIVFTQSAPEGQSLNLKRIGGDSESDLRLLSADFKIAHDWHGNTLLFGKQSPDGPYNLWHLAIDGSGKSEIWFASKANHRAAQFSPDGRWVADVSDETGTNHVYVRRFPAADGQVRISNAGGREPRWRHDQKAAFYVQRDVLMEVDLDIGETAKPGEPRPLFPLGTLEESCGYAVLPDDKRFVVCRRIDPVAPPTITVVVNWAAGLKQK